jgi:hypothetical protein
MNWKQTKFCLRFNDDNDDDNARLHSKVKVKLSCYRFGQALGVPGG